MHEASLLGYPPFWVAVAFVIFFVLFGGKLWKALTAILDKRSDMVRSELAEAQRLRREAEAMLQDASVKREAALDYARKLLEGAKVEAARLAAEAAAEAGASATRREQMAYQRINAAEKAAVDDVRISAADIATQAASRVIRDHLGAEADAALLDHAIAGLPAALAPRRAA